METLNPLYQHNIGQRTGLSFLDVKAINLAYCQGKHIIGIRIWVLGCDVLNGSNLFSAKIFIEMRRHTN